MATPTKVAMASRIRRKPLATYKSPTPGEQVFAPRNGSQSKGRRTYTTSKASSKSSRSIQSTKESSSSSATPRRLLMSPPLPLFHPLGHLAMSLPPLDPARYGLPLLSVSDELEDRQPSRSSKRPATKSQEIEDEIPATTVSAVAAVAAREAKERASPRKRRNGGTGGGGAKRKRKEVDDGDATYPAKRTRLPRGAANQGLEEEEAPLDITPAAIDVAAESLADLVEKRRSTRSRGGAKRRSSSESETASISANANGSASKGGTDGPSLSKVGDGGPTSDAAELETKESEKEEGELSA
ncbi:hypothetical protein CPB83DRAFT_853038 [Crepidotus variabilis]|uniref:Uncharacterized protein n=1 Tax=Crepidotus variabilis TaxID=179855 RepID=A0A9P6JR84_9AGAR|nr:hypothetical protein CPB83DRAFT_853038 [Crepidotus variabilis]